MLLRLLLRMAVARIGWERIGARLAFAGANSFLHGGVDFEDNALGAVLAPLFLVFALDDRKGFQVGNGISRSEEMTLELGMLLKSLIIQIIALTNIFLFATAPAADPLEDRFTKPNLFDHFVKQ